MLLSQSRYIASNVRLIGPKGAVLQALLEPPPPCRSQRQPPWALSMDGRYVVFLDGGSRSNTSPGGAGSVILRTDATASTAQLICSAAMSLAARTMNN
jgi:hypothetical protein